MVSDAAYYPQIVNSTICGINVVKPDSRSQTLLNYVRYRFEIQNWQDIQARCRREDAPNFVAGITSRKPVDFLPVGVHPDTRIIIQPSHASLTIVCAEGRKPVLVNRASLGGERTARVREICRIRV
jgi:hypothetical protein